MSKKQPIEAAEIPEHMLDAPVSRAQKKAFAKVKRQASREEAEKSTRKSTKKSEA